MRQHLEYISTKLSERIATGTLRTLTTTKGLTDFASNDYLGYTSKNWEYSKLIGALGQGAGGSRLLTGNCDDADTAECLLADYFQAEACLIFPSGYLANIALLSCLPSKGDTILYDSLIHASVKDGYRLQLGAVHRAFRHNDLADLEKKLSGSKGKKWIVVESVYSMDGDRAPLKELAAICRQYDAALVLDEAHSTGLWGPNGAGLAIADNIQADCFARVYTFGKAMGYHGACIAGSKILIDYLVNYARPFIYTTGQPREFYQTISERVAYRQANPQEFNVLLKNIALYHNYIVEAGLDVEVNNSPIQIIKIEGVENLRAATQTLNANGFDVRPILPPTVPQGSERLRICLHAFNTENELKNLVSTIGTFL
jgi:8-amino-7-oxononanoate synthase